MAEETKHCGTCKYGYLSSGYEPCKSCGDDCSNWEVGLKIVSMEEQGKEPEKYKYYVTYCVVNIGHVFWAIIERGSKISSPKDIREIVVILARKKELNVEEITILDWKELEG